MSGLLIGYARVSTEEQDLTAQRDGLAALGVEPSRIYVDHGLTSDGNRNSTTVTYRPRHGAASELPSDNPKRARARTVRPANAPQTGH